MEIGWSLLLAPQRGASFNICVSFVYLIFAVLKPGLHVLLLNIRVSLYSMILEKVFSEQLVVFYTKKRIPALKDVGLFVAGLL